MEVKEGETYRPIGGFGYGHCLKERGLADHRLGQDHYYDCSSHCGKITRSGEPYNPESFTIAVDDDLWEELSGELVRVTNLETGKALLLRVNDTGYLGEKGVAGDLPESVWSLISGKPLSEGVFQGLIERFDQG